MSFWNGKNVTHGWNDKHVRPQSDVKKYRVNGGMCNNCIIFMNEAGNREVGAWGMRGFTRDYLEGRGSEHFWFQIKKSDAVDPNTAHFIEDKTDCLGCKAEVHIKIKRCMGCCCNAGLVGLKVWVKAPENDKQQKKVAPLCPATFPDSDRMTGDTCPETCQWHKTKKCFKRCSRTAEAAGQSCSMSASCSSFVASVDSVASGLVRIVLTAAVKKAQVGNQPYTSHCYDRSSSSTIKKCCKVMNLDNGPEPIAQKKKTAKKSKKKAAKKAAKKAVKAKALSLAKLTPKEIKKAKIGTIEALLKKYNALSKLLLQRLQKLKKEVK